MIAADRFFGPGRQSDIQNFAGAMDFILENLAIGNCGEAMDPPSEIDAMLCVAQEIDIPEPRCSYYKVPIVDMQPIPAKQLMDAVIWIRDNIGRNYIMVFCNAGVGRSPSVVVAYLCCVRGFTFGSAVEYVAARKPYMSILPNLIKVIEEVEKTINESGSGPSG